MSIRSGWQQTKREILLYVLVGGVQLVADWLSFVGLTWLGMNVVPANLCGRVLGAILGFWLNGKLTFAKNGTEGLGSAQVARFATSWLIMTLLSTGAVWLVEQLTDVTGARLAKPFIDAALAGLGFLTSKLWIYR